MSNVIQLPSQPVFDTPRSIAGKELMLTRINSTLRLSAEQSMNVLDVNERRTFRRHFDAVKNLSNLGGGRPFLPQDWLVIYSLPVTCHRDSVQWGGGGGTQMINFYHPEMLFHISMRTRNTPSKAAVVKWLINLGDEVIQQDFALDQHAVQNDPNVINQLQAELAKAKQDAQYWQSKYTSIPLSMVLIK